MIDKFPHLPSKEIYALKHFSAGIQKLIAASLRPGTEEFLVAYIHCLSNIHSFLLTELQFL